MTAEPLRRIDPAVAEQLRVDFVDRLAAWAGIPTETLGSDGVWQMDVPSDDVDDDAVPLETAVTARALREVDQRAVIYASEPHRVFFAPGLTWATAFRAAQIARRASGGEPWTSVDEFRAAQTPSTIAALDAASGPPHDCSDG